MIVSMIQLIVELPEATSLKEKRSVVHGLRDRIRVKFRVSAAEVDLLDSLRFAHLGCALVSNSQEHGERVMQAILDFAERELAMRIQDAQIHSERF